MQILIIDADSPAARRTLRTTASGKRSRGPHARQHQGHCAASPGDNTRHRHPGPGKSDSSGAGVIAKVRHRWPSARVLVLTAQQDDRALAEALRDGADAYLLKSDSRLELIAALHSVAQGQRYVSPTMHVQPRDHSTTGQHQLDGLTDRERDVMRRIARGQRTREIAVALSLSHKTIEKHRGSLMRKLGLKTATAVVAYAIANGYLDN